MVAARTGLDGSLMSHTATVRSSLPLASSCPSALKLTGQAAWRCSRAARRGCPGVGVATVASGGRAPPAGLVTSHRIVVPSSLVARSRPSGLNASAATPLACDVRNAVGLGEGSGRLTRGGNAPKAIPADSARSASLRASTLFSASCQASAMKSRQPIMLGTVIHLPHPKPSATMPAPNAEAASAARKTACRRARSMSRPLPRISSVAAHARRHDNHFTT